MDTTTINSLDHLIKPVQRKLGLTPDGIAGPKTWAAIHRALDIEGRELIGDGTWPFTAWVVGNDIVVRSVRATCFGGSNDPQDSGETASGVSTKDNPKLKGCALPMAYTGTNKALRKALGGSPIPRVPWNTMVEVTSVTGRIVIPVIDLGPAKKTGNAIDLTIAAAREFNPKATATSFEAIVDYRIIGGARYV